ncbi:TRAP transporter small permease [Mesorhizobium sp. M6A.T.Ce.TU.002.03.1.1]|uniref:TRAP transporter small permease n=1 Tax=Mesorhizobium sp. M6A.T.Ce.TU.002.03.1.1 TaxID=2496782 RepID=UPI000FC9BCC4|nr:TRAP transporter small permease [Mesorhizobium sp. M6A.T.Ce.TU.002.03.1.1]RUU43872.1 TRAP transporter small permease [Mesorhizobium sp. M6A.T.Ce.TU.002.03.1.1]
MSDTMPPSQDMIVLGRIEKWQRRCEFMLVYAAVTATAIMMLLTSADAVCRYFLNSPILIAYELTEKYLMTAAIFLGLPSAFRGGAFIRVTFLVDRLSPLPRSITDHLAYIVAILCCLVFAAATVQQAYRSLFEPTTLSALPIPVGPAYLLPPLGFLILALAILTGSPRRER